MPSNWGGGSGGSGGGFVGGWGFNGSYWGTSNNFNGYYSTGTSGYTVGTDKSNWESIKEWAQIRTRSPRNFLRFTFNLFENTGTTLELIGLVLAPFTEGTSLSITEVGFIINSIGVWGNAGIDVYDGKFGSASLSLIRHYSFYGLGKLINKASGGLTDEMIMLGISNFYDKIVIPRMGDNYFTNNINSQFERIEYK